MAPPFTMIGMWSLLFERVKLGLSRGAVVARGVLIAQESPRVWSVGVCVYVFVCGPMLRGASDALPPSSVSCVWWISALPLSSTLSAGQGCSQRTQG